MSMKSRMDEYLRQQAEEQKKMEEKKEQENQIAVAELSKAFETVIQALEVEKKLVEIKEEIWQAGSIEHRLAETGISLVAKWYACEYHEEGTGENSYGGNYYYIIEKTIRITVFVDRTSKFTYKSGRVGSKEVFVLNIRNTIYHPPYYQDYNKVIDINLPIDPTTKEWFDRCLTKVCVFNGCLHKTIEADRQVIIQRLLNGALKRNDLPKDFQLPPDVLNQLLQKEAEKRAAQAAPKKKWWQF